MEDNIVAFLGRFHPLIVHLPIGFLIMSGLLQLYAVKIKNSSINLNHAIAFTLFWGTIASIGAVAIGWLLSLQGGYDSDILFWHKWLGILVTLLSFFGWILKTERIRLRKSVFSVVLMLIIILISMSGHLGGSLTHGETYLLHYAPQFIKNIAGVGEEEKVIALHDIHIDSIKVYPHIIQPILDDKCISCHNDTKKEGGLLLDNYRGLMEGGDDGSIIDLKTPLESTLLNRVTLPASHKKFMPPRGTSLTFGEIQVIEWWMKTGADSIVKFSDKEVLDDKLINTLLRDYQLDYNPKPYYEKIVVEKLPPDVINELQENNFVIDFLGESNHMISVAFKGKSISSEQISKLLRAKEQITWLDLSNCNLTDSHLKSISDLNNLTRLNLHTNPITDEGIELLTPLENIVSLNLYNTKISNISLSNLTKLKGLKTLYVWKTGITVTAIDEVAKDYPQITIISELK